MPEGVQYRVLGKPDPGDEVTAVEPNLEDSYIWLMNQARAKEHLIRVVQPPK